jgi:hypothetical protein
METHKNNQTRKKNSKEKECPPGLIHRKSYVRKFSRGLMERGYTVKRDTGVQYRILPKHSSVYVKPGCIKPPVGFKNPGKLSGAMAKGKLKLHGYVYTNSERERHESLVSAISQYGYRSIIKKLKALLKFSKTTNLQAFRVFEQDTRWVINYLKQKQV